MGQFYEKSNFYIDVMIKFIGKPASISEQAVYRTLPNNRNPQALYHGTNVPESQWRGDFLEPSSKIVEVTYKGQIVNLNTDGTKYLFAGTNPKIVTPMAFKNEQVFAQTIYSVAGKPVPSLYVDDLSKYLSTVNHVARLFKIPVPAVLEAEFKNVLHLDGKPTDRYITPKAVRIEDCSVEEVRLDDLISKGLQIFYLKHPHRIRDIIDFSRIKNLEVFSPHATEEAIKAGILERYKQG